VLGPGDGKDDIPHEFIKGEISGLELAKKMPQLLIDEIERQMEDMPTTEEQELTDHDG
jgi:hypothetical protein